MARQYVLIVEDDPRWQKLVAEGVTDAGFMPVVAATPEKARQALSDYTFSLAIVDLSLVFNDFSNRQGIDILQEIARLRRRLPAIIMTGYPDIDLNIETLVQIKPVHFFSKKQINWHEFTGVIKKEALSSPAVASLSQREWEVLELLRQGQTNKKMAGLLSVSPNTIKKHLQNIFTKLQVNSRAEAVAKAMEQSSRDSQ